MRAGEFVEYSLPPGTDTLRAMVGLDDREPAGSPVRFTVELDGKRVRQSRPLCATDRELAYVNVRGGMRLILRVEGRSDAAVNWGGAKLTRNDAEARLTVGAEAATSSAQGTCGPRPPSKQGLTFLTVCNAFKHALASLACYASRHTRACGNVPAC